MGEDEAKEQNARGKNKNASSENRAGKLQKLKKAGTKPHY
jgi:hypothetical protein